MPRTTFRTASRLAAYPALRTAADAGEGLPKSGRVPFEFSQEQDPRLDFTLENANPVCNNLLRSPPANESLLAQGWAESEILRNYPGLEREDLLVCWAYASEALSGEIVYRFQVA